MFKFVRKTDELDEIVCSILENMLENPPTKENTDFVYTDITDMAMSLPPVESLLAPNFFIRAPLGFHLLRRTLELDLVNRKSEDAVLSVTVPQDDCEDPRLLEHIWFLLFLGATETDIEYNVCRYRDEIRSRSRSGSQTPPVSLVFTINHEQPLWGMINRAMIGAQS